MRDTAPTIGLVESNRHTGPWCLAPVHVPEIPYTNVQRGRVEMTAGKGIPRNACGQPAGYEYNGQQVCARHAGELSLGWLMDARRPIERRMRDVIDVR